LAPRAVTFADPRAVAFAEPRVRVADPLAAEALREAALRLRVAAAFWAAAWRCVRVCSAIQ
jgi:hypothetical protein